MNKGFLLVISGPSGSGKGTICKKLLERNRDLVLSVSATTRKPRKGEIDGVNYFFVDEDKFEEMIRNNEFLEHANVHGNKYGTPMKFVVDQIENGEIVILEIDVQGALQVKNIYNEAILIFLLPPSMEELKNRINKRGTETKEDIDIRLNNAYRELKLIDKYDYVVVNDKVDDAVENIEIIINAEKLKVKRMKKILDNIINN